MRPVRADMAPGLTADDRGHLSMLWRRMLHLERRLADYRGKDPSMDRSELAALRWALKRANVPLPPPREDATIRSNPDLQES